MALAHWIVRRLMRPRSVDRACRQILHDAPGALAVPRTLQILNESLELMNKTTVPSTFFCRYDTALAMAEQTLEFSLVKEHIAYAEEVMDHLLTELDAIAKAFIDRCHKKGTLPFIKDELLGNDTVFSEVSKQYLLDILSQDE